MRAFRALAMAGMAVSAWIGWRAAVVSADLAQGTAPAPAAAFAPPAFATLAVGPPQPVEGDGFGWRDPAPPQAAVAAPGSDIRYIPVPVAYPSRASAEAGRDPPSRPRRPDLGWGADSYPDRTDEGRYAFLGGADQQPPPVTATPPPKAPRPATGMLDKGWSEASQAYASLAAGDRPAAAEGLRLAISLAPDHPNAGEWRREHKRLTKSWRIEVASLQRPVSDGQLPAGSQVLGSTVTTTFLGWSPNPMGRRPAELFARAIVANRQSTLDGDAGVQAAVGAQWRPFANVPITIAAERLIAAQQPARDDFSIRAFGGLARGWRGFQADAFGEAGVIGEQADWFFGGQAAVVRPVQLPGRFTAALGGGVWGAVQNAGLTLSRVDVGPTLRLRRTNFPLYLNADYRFRVQGDALPGSGPAITVVTTF